MNWLTFITDADGSVLGDPADNTSPETLHLLSELSLCTEQLVSRGSEVLCAFLPPDLGLMEPPNDDH